MLRSSPKRGWHVIPFVGKVNLVEKIARLARVRLDDVSKLGDSITLGWRERGLREAVKDGENKENVAYFYGNGGGGGAPKKPKQIVKEGLSEYFIYTIEGTESAALMIRRYDQREQPHTQRPTAGPKSF